MRSFLYLLLLTVHSVFAVGESVVGAYYENWSQYRPAAGGRVQFMPNLIDPNIITDLYYAFAIFGYVSKSIDPSNPHLTGDYTVQPVEWNDQTVLYPQVMDLKKQNPNLRNLLSIGGWSFNDPNDPNGMGQHTCRLFSEMVATESNRTQFIESAIAYANKYGFNGIDIDWEYPGDLTRGGRAEDLANFLQFLKEAYPAFQKAGLLLTYASSAIVPTGVPESYHRDPATYFQWLAACSKYLDRLNIMAYDYHGPFDNPMLTGVNAPLNKDTNPDSTLNILTTLNLYLDNGVPADKIVLGMATYGHSFGGVNNLSESDFGPGKAFQSAGPAGPSTGTPGFLAYFEIADKMTLKELTFGVDSLTSTAEGYNLLTKEWVSFDTPQTIALKAQLAKDKSLLGIMFWAVDDDEYQWSPKYPNISSGYEVFIGKKNH